jgi:hypothetical protein
VQGLLHNSLLRSQPRSHFRRSPIDGAHFPPLGCSFITIFLVNEQGIGLDGRYSFGFQATQGDVKIGGDLDLKTLTVIGTVSVGSPRV